MLLFIFLTQLANLTVAAVDNVDSAVASIAKPHGAARRTAVVGLLPHPETS